MGLVVVDSIREEDRERVEGLAPSVDAGDDVVAGASLLFYNEVKDFECCLFCGEVSAASGGLPEPAVEAFDHVGGVHDSSNLDIEVEEWAEAFLGLPPHADHGWIFCGPTLRELREAFLGLGPGRRGVDGAKARGDVLPILARAVA